MQTGGWPEIPTISNANVVSYSENLCKCPLLNTNIVLLVPHEYFEILKQLRKPLKGNCITEAL